MHVPSPARAKIEEAALRLFAERGGGEIAVSDLAEAAGVARGTIYNNIERPEDLFADVAASLSREMIARVEATMAGIDDPAVRLATGLRLFVRRAHEEPHWGRFITRFAASSESLGAMMNEPPARDVALAIEAGRFRLDTMKMKSAIGLLAGAVVAAMQSVAGGRQTWRDAGADSAELFLRACGLSAAEARKIASADLPPLAAPPPVRKRKRKP